MSKAFHYGKIRFPIDVDRLVRFDLKPKGVITDPILAFQEGLPLEE